MKQGWEIKKIGQCFSSINNGANIKQIKGASGLPITRIETISNDRFNRDRMGYANIIDYKPYSKYLLSDGDILMSHINSMKFLGRAVVYKKRNNEVILHGMNLLRLIPINDIILSYYAVLYFRTELFKKDIGAISHQSVNQASFNITALKNLDIPVPPLAEQERIVEILDREFERIDALKANAEQNLQHAKDLFQAALKQELQPKEGWIVSTLQALLRLTSGDNLTAKSIVQGEYPVYGGNGIMGYHNQYNLDGLNVIVGRVGALCGNVRLVKGKIWYTDNAFLVHDKENVFYLPYLTYELQRADLRQYATQAAQPVVSNASMKDVVLAAPATKEEQELIVARLDKLKEHCKALEENYTKTIALCDDMKQALLRKVFNGEL